MPEPGSPVTSSEANHERADHVPGQYNAGNIINVNDGDVSGSSRPAANNKMEQTMSKRRRPKDGMKKAFRDKRKKDSIISPA